MHPVLFQIGDFSFPSFGAAMAFSMLLGIFLATRRMVYEGFDEILAYQAFLMSFLGVVVCAHLVDVIVHFRYYLENPVDILKFTKGIVFYGGLIGAIVFPAVFLKLKKQPVLGMIDTPATYLGMGLLIHRALGCFMAGCCFGRPTSCALGVVFPPDAPASRLYGQVAVFPTQLFESFYGLIMLGAGLYWRNKKRKVYGEIIALEITLYGIGRFIIEFFRGDDSARGVFSWISTSQIISIIMLLFAAGFWVFLFRRRKLVREGRMDPKGVVPRELPVKWT